MADLDQFEFELKVTARFFTAWQWTLEAVLRLFWGFLAGERGRG